MLLVRPPPLVSSGPIKSCGRNGKGNKNTGAGGRGRGGLLLWRLPIGRLYSSGGYFCGGYSSCGGYSRGGNYRGELFVCWLYSSGNHLVTLVEVVLSLWRFLLGSNPVAVTPSCVAVTLVAVSPGAVTPSLAATSVVVTPMASYSCCFLLLLSLPLLGVALWYSYPRGGCTLVPVIRLWCGYLHGVYSCDRYSCGGYSSVVVTPMTVILVWQLLLVL